jgi:hypothetical protein
MTWRLLQLIIAFMVLFLAATPCPAPAGYLYNKNYIIRQDRGQDILCDPYTVQKNDWVIKLFQRRGQIAEQDFPEFLSIFNRLNPHVADVDKILPGQHILIPLKKLENESLPGQSSGIVTIPFVAISSLPDFIKKDATEYTVKSGDNISEIISDGYGKLGTQSYHKGIELFKLINPEVTDLDRIYPGQTIHIPDPGLQDKAWYAALFDESGQINADIDVKSLVAPRNQPKVDVPAGKPILPPMAGSAMANEEPSEEQSPATLPATPAPSRQNISPLKKAAAALNAKVLDKGTYYFPGQAQKDFKLDLSRYPVMELTDGSRILFCEKDDFSMSDKNTMISFWKDLKIVPLPFQSTLEQVLEAIFASNDKYDLKNRLTLDDHGAVIDIKAKWIIRSNPSDLSQNKTITCIFLQDGTSPPVSDSLMRCLSEWRIMIREIAKDGSSPAAQDVSRATPVQESQNALVSLQKNLNGVIDDMVTAMGCHYSEKINISFPYAGIQVNALSNLISTPKGRQLLVDYGDLYGDALTAIRKTGLNIIQLGGIKDWQTALKTVFSGLNFPFTEHLDFKAVARSDDTYIRIHIPGLVVETDAREKILITPALFRSAFAQFLTQSGYCVILASSGDSAVETPTPAADNQTASPPG